MASGTTAHIQDLSRAMRKRNLFYRRHLVVTSEKIGHRDNVIIKVRGMHDNVFRILMIIISLNGWSKDVRGVGFGGLLIGCCFFVLILRMGRRLLGLTISIFL